MADIRVKIKVKDDGSKVVQKFSKTTDKSFTKIATSSKKMGVSFAKSAVKLIALAGAGTALSKLAKSFLGTARMTENFKVRLEVLLGSVKEGNRLFKAMADYAGKVPFEYQKIMEGATMLAGVLKGGVNDIVKWMPLIGDLAAATGLTITETSEQMMRVFGAGINAADRFRDRGIKAMLGFKAKTEYTAEESAKKIWQEWSKAGSKFRGTTERMAKTWDGLMSMMSDKWTQIKQEVMDAGIYDALKNVLQSILDIMDAWVIKATDVSGSIQKIADNINTANNFIMDHKEILLTVLKITGAIAAIWIGGKIIAVVGFLVKSFIGIGQSLRFVWLLGKSVVKEIGMLSRGTIKIGLALKNWGALAVHMYKYMKFIRFTLWGIVYTIFEQLISVIWESYKAVGDLSGVWDITLRKMKSLLEGFRHFFTIAWLYIVKTFQGYINLMLRNWGRFLDFIREHTPQRLQEWLGIPTKGAITQLMFADRLIEEESKRHLAALKRIRDEYMESPTGKMSQVRGIAKSMVEDIRADQPAAVAPREDMWKSWSAGEGYAKDMWGQWSSAAEEATGKVTVLVTGMDQLFGHLIEKTKTWFEVNEEILLSIGQNITSTFVDGFADAMLGVKSFQEAFSQMAASLASDLMRIAIKMMFLQAIESAFGGGSSIFKFFGGGKASGGPVSGGTPYMVGERGPELFVPGQSGGIIPNNKMGGGGDVNINIQVQAQPGMSDEEAKRQGMAAARAFNNQVDQRILKSTRAGGLLYGGR